MMEKWLVWFLTSAPLLQPATSDVSLLAPQMPTWSPYITFCNCLFSNISGDYTPNVGTCAQCAVIFSSVYTLSRSSFTACMRLIIFIPLPPTHQHKFLSATLKYQFLRPNKYWGPSSKYSVLKQLPPTISGKLHFGWRSCTEILEILIYYVQRIMFVFVLGINIL